MKISIKKIKTGVLFAFTVDSDKFESNYERNKFFRGLYGWKQIITKGRKVYTYHREGLLDAIPHMKIDQSSFIVPEDEFDKVFDFFEKWRKKIIWKTFKVLLEEDIDKFFEKEEV